MKRNKTNKLTAAKFFMFCTIPPLKSPFRDVTVAFAVCTLIVPFPMLRLIVRFSSVSCAMATIARPAMAPFPVGAIFWLFWRMAMPFVTKLRREAWVAE